MSGSFGLILAVILAAWLFKNRRPKKVTLVLVLVGAASLVVGNFVGGMLSPILGYAPGSLGLVSKATAGAVLVVGLFVELLGSPEPSQVQ